MSTFDDLVKALEEFKPTTPNPEGIGGHGDLPSLEQALASVIKQLTETSGGSSLSGPA